ncbi:hypothetical protein EJB05_55432 [Eragrostis curvula]|uniref:Terpene synthase N-terminal domain-containing protein n=1 Tax=Eragrostis curvula TaxID=38414 RepID=A0A5J9SJP4_9POAL|nr:hypothetical protein EJB05_55432 [Eragrostis curvula]
MYVTTAALRKYDAFTRLTGAKPQRRPFLDLHTRRRRRRGCIMRLANGDILAPGSREPLGQTKNSMQDNKKYEPREVLEMTHYIRAMLKSMGDGVINASAYDTAWVALVKDLDGGDGPQFPKSIDWIIQNQLPDGSWGDETFYLVQDRFINTLACIITLRSWNIHIDKCNKGLGRPKTKAIGTASTSPRHRLLYKINVTANAFIL